MSEINDLNVYGVVKMISSNTFTSNKEYAVKFENGAIAGVEKNTYTSNMLGNCCSLGAEETFEFSNLGKPSMTLSQKNKNVTVKWKKVDAAGKYQVAKATTNKASSFKIVKNADISARSYKNKKIKKGKKYYYKMRSVRKMNGVTQYSPYTSVKGIKIK